MDEQKRVIPQIRQEVAQAPPATLAETSPGTPYDVMQEKEQEEQVQLQKDAAVATAISHFKQSQFSAGGIK